MLEDARRPGQAQYLTVSCRETCFSGDRIIGTKSLNLMEKAVTKEGIAASLSESVSRLREELDRVEKERNRLEKENQSLKVTLQELGDGLEQKTDPAVLTKHAPPPDAAGVALSLTLQITQHIISTTCQTLGSRTWHD